jgi:hypothetical protein
VKWALLETARPEEAVVAAARVRFPGGSGGRAVIDLFAAATDEQRDQLLVRVETSVQSFNAASLVVEVPQWRDDTQEWLCRCGYVDGGGHEWPERSKHMLLKHTMVLEFQKLLASGDADAAEALQNIQHLSVSGSSGAQAVESLFTSGFSSGPDGVMESLVEDLFVALYRDNNAIFDTEDAQK